jgi:hypothetical protein
VPAEPLPSCDEPNCGNLVREILVIKDVLLVLFLLASGTSCVMNNTTMVEEAGITISERRVIQSDSSYNGFPAVVEMSNGNYLLVYRKGNSHVDTPNIIVRSSSDQGTTWSPEVAVWNTNNPDPALARMPSSGDILIELEKNNQAELTGSAFARSKDNGSTWSSFTFFDSPVSNTFATPTRYLIDGMTVYAASYGALADGSDDVKIWKSTDDGYTWSAISSTRQAGDAGINETTIAKVGATKLLAVSRDDANTNTWAHFSEDSGMTWGSQIDYTPQVGVLQLPQLIQAGDALLLFGRQFDSHAATPPHAFVMFASLDGGMTFTYRTVLDTYTGYLIDGGYCWPILREDGKVFVAYYADSDNLHQPDIKSLVLQF